MKKALWTIMAVFAVLLSGYAVVQYYVLGADHAGFVEMKMETITLSSIWYGVLYAHVVGSVAALLIGPLNLSRSFRKRNIQRHRILGSVYIAGVWLGGISGLYLAFQATGGLVSTIGFLGLDLWWLVSSYYGVKRIRDKQPLLHRQWMIRNYALTLAGVNLRLWLGLFVVMFGEENFVASYTVIAWLSWVPNMIIAEIYIRRRPKQSIQAVASVHPNIAAYTVNMREGLPSLGDPSLVL
ncbi:MAG: putative rane protein [Paenibacillus sp.]|nr:putative rane protein [Paenibacillus sp.]